MGQREIHSLITSTKVIIAVSWCCCIASTALQCGFMKCLALWVKENFLLFSFWSRSKHTHLALWQLQIFLQTSCGLISSQMTSDYLTLKGLPDSRLKLAFLFYFIWSDFVALAGALEIFVWGQSYELIKAVPLASKQEERTSDQNPDTGS